jgi:hypothetical protein
MLKTNGGKWQDPDGDWRFVDNTRWLSECLRSYAEKVHDPEVFTETVGNFLRRFAREVEDIKLSVNDKQGEEEIKNCPYRELPAREELVKIKRQVTPYPLMVAANYLAAIGSVDTGILILENWIKRLRNWSKQPACEWAMI